METPEQQEAFQTKYIPKQTKPKAVQLNGGEMKVNVVTYPPLGQVTVLNSKQAVFQVVLDVDSSKASDAWEVALWYSQGGEWEEQLLKSGGQSFTVQSYQKNCLHFSGILDVKAITNFTVKFRCASEWKWAKDNQGAQDGCIISRGSATLAETKVDDLIGDLNPAIEWEKVTSETPNTSVWSLTASIAGAKGDESAFSKMKLGRPWKGDFLK